VITLYTFGPAFGLPDPSPFVMKAEMLLKLAKLPYRADTGGFRRAPKGKLPYIDDEGTIVADSSLIRFHIEKKYGIDLDAGLAPAERGVAWAFEKMCEEHLYWGLVIDRWMDERNFRAGPLQFFDRAPAPVRPFVVWAIRRQVRKTLRAQGLGRHAPTELQSLVARDFDAIADHLGEKPYFMGEHPTGADATIFAFIAGALCETFTAPTRDAAARHTNLVAYRDRMMREFYPPA
jgi:glutathione S-transferase